MHLNYTQGGSLLSNIGQSASKNLRTFFLLSPLVSSPSFANTRNPPLRYSHNFGKMMTCAATPSPVSHPRYDILNHDLIEEYNITATLYQHKDTSAKLLSYSTPQSEPEKVFAIGFRTPPLDHTGCAHVVEHSVLCGSDKYPLKEPFVELLKGSLNTFLNAHTYPEGTYYPVASTNVKDFYNLADVYMDAVLHPRAMKDPDVLKQEGTRLSIEQIKDSDNESPSEKLVYSGVVFNEMKAKINQMGYNMPKTVYAKLFDKSHYQYRQGGDPRYIRELTFDKFKSFYEKYYHPANAKVVFWGSDDVYKRLEFVNNHLANATMSSNPVEPTWQPEPYTGEPRHFKIPAPMNQGKLEDSLVVAWSLGTIAGDTAPFDSQMEIEFSILTDLILSSSVSVLHKALLSSGLGTDIYDSGYSNLFKRNTFSVGLNGIKQEEGNTQQVEKLIMDTLQKSVDEGFSKMAIESSINKLEFKLKECSFDDSKGLSMSVAALLDMTVEANPIENWKFDKQFESLREKLEKGEPVFQNLIKKYLIDNKHKVVLHFESNEEYVKKINEEEENSLKSLQSQLKAEDFEEIKMQDAKLKERQETPDTPEAIATMPILNLEDLDKTNYETPTEVMTINGRTVLKHELPTAGIIYANLCFDLDALSLDDFDYLPLFCMMIERSGTTNFSEVELQHFIDSNTGGVSIASTVFTNKRGMNNILDNTKANGYLVMSGKSTAAKVDKLFTLFSEMLQNTDFSNKEVGLQRLKESLADLEQSISFMGNRFVSKHVTGSQSVAGYVDEKMSGFSYLFTLRNLIKPAEKDWEPVQRKLEDLRKKIIKSNSMLVNLTSEKGLLDSLTQSNDEGSSKIDKLISEFSSTDESKASEPNWVSEANENKVVQQFSCKGFAMETQVNYVCLSGRLFEPEEEASFGKIYSYSLAMTFGYLWDKVRALGGAYGVSFQFSRSGYFTFTSYRDPNLNKTLEAYENAPNGFYFEVDENDMLSGDEEARMEVANKMKKAIISAIGKLDTPKRFGTQGAEAMWNFINGETAEDRQKFRDEILSLTYKDFNAISKQLQKALSDPSKLTISILSSEEALKNYQKENPKMNITMITEDVPMATNEVTN